MKSFKILSYIIVLLFCSHQLSAQKYRFRAGLNLSNMLVKDDVGSFPSGTDQYVGFHLGITAQYGIGSKFFFEPEVLISSKGFQFEEEIDLSGTIVNAEGKFKPLYLDIPLTFKIYLVKESKGVYFALGPYIGVGIGGKNETTLSVLGNTETRSTDIDWGSGENDDFKRFDLGIKTRAGIEFNSFLFDISYDYGITNIVAHPMDGSVLKNRVLRFSIGYILPVKS